MLGYWLGGWLDDEVVEGVRGTGRSGGKGTRRGGGNGKREEEGRREEGKRERSMRL